MKLSGIPLFLTHSAASPQSAGLPQKVCARMFLLQDQNVSEKSSHQKVSVSASCYCLQPGTFSLPLGEHNNIWKLAGNTKFKVNVWQVSAGVKFGRQRIINKRGISFNYI